MKRFAILFSIIIFASLTYGSFDSHVQILQTGNGFSGLAFPNGMSSQVDENGVYWAVISDYPQIFSGGYLTPDAPNGSVIYGDSSQLGLGLDNGIYGYFGSSEQSWSATPGLFLDGFSQEVGLSLYLINDQLTEATYIYSQVLTPIEVQADAGGAYQVGPGQTVLLDGSASYADQYGDVAIDKISWYIDDMEVGQDEMLSLSYKTLTQDLGLSMGIHQVKICTTADWAGPDSDWTTLEIVPEPTSLVLLVLGGLALRRRKLN